MTFFWFIAMIVFAAAEGATVSLVSVWFIGGALTAMVASMLGASIALQTILFVAVSAVLLASVRPIVRKYAQTTVTPTNVNALLGKRALVTERVDNLRATGAIRINGVIWTARSSDDRIIEPDTLVCVDSVEGVKLYVSPAAAAVSK